MLKRIATVFFIYMAVCCSAFAVRGTPPDAINALGKKAGVYTHQRPALLVVGPARLFYDRCLPRLIENYFDVYYVDIYEKSSNEADISNYTLDNFVDGIENIRQGLGLDKMVLFGHSSNGILALKYSYKYPQYVSVLILVGTTPFRGKDKRDISEKFFKEYAGEDRQDLYFKDQQKLENKANHTFIDEYNAKRALNFYNPFDETASKLWNGIDLDLELTDKYFSLIDSFDIRQEKQPFMVPTFLALGKYDYTCPFVLWDLRRDKDSDQKHEQGFFEMFHHPLLTTEFFEKSAHFPMMEERQLFIERLLLFLKGQRIVDHV